MTSSSITITMILITGYSWPSLQTCTSSWRTVIVILVVVASFSHRYSRLAWEWSLMPTPLVQVQWMIITYVLCQWCLHVHMCEDLAAQSYPSDWHASTALKVRCRWRMMLPLLMIDDLDIVDDALWMSLLLQLIRAFDLNVMMIEMLTIMAVVL